MSIKTEREQLLAVRLFAERLRLLDYEFAGFFSECVTQGIKINSLNEVIELKAETVHEELIFTEMIFKIEFDLPYSVKSAVIKEFSDIFRV